jgi:hypothetical protein
MKRYERSAGGVVQKKRQKKKNSWRLPRNEKKQTKNNKIREKKGATSVESWKRITRR